MKKIISAIAATAIAASLALSTTVASAETYYTIPMDPAEWSTWMVNNPMLNETENLGAEETSEGMEVWFPDTATVQIPNFLLNVGAGITEVTKGDDLHIDITLEGDDGAMDMRWFVEIGFNGAGIERMNISKYIAAATGNDKLQPNDYGQLPSGTYDVVLDMEELIKAYDADNDTTNYDKIWNSGADNTRLLTTINFNVATTDPAKNSDKDNHLIIRDFSLGTDGSFEGTGNGGTASTGSTASTASTGSTASTASTGSKSSTTGSSSKTQVGTGENLLPVIGIAALAVVATSAVVVTKKRAK